jgi:hypothetical protein
MKKVLLSWMCLSLLVLALANTSYAWQGRMGGMGDPYGLVSDESAFLIHPAKITNGQGIKLYGDYRFTYTGVPDWNVDIAVLTATPSFDMSGDGYRHNALLGAAFPLWLGRMGILFTYDGERGTDDGNFTTASDNYIIQFDNTIDNFAVRLLYGLPLGNFKLGAEFGLAYCQEENRRFIYYADLTSGYVNLPNMNDALIPPFAPYDSTYWEIPLKAGVEGKVGPLDLEFTLRGGVIVSGDNKLAIENQSPVGVVTSSADLDGDAQGWRIGGDLWLRYPLAEGVSLPFLFKIDYRTKSRDGDAFIASIPVDYATKETNLDLQVGGGVDGKLSEKTRFAAGIYYGYLHDEADFSFMESLGGFLASFDCGNYPALTEHRAILRLAEEHEFSPSFAMRFGLEFFYGWAAEDLMYDIYLTPDTITLPFSLHGSHWGIGGSLGGTVKFQRLTLEPFFNVGYQSLRLEGDGQESVNGVPLAGAIIDREDMRNQWFVSTGLSVLFDL